MQTSLLLEMAADGLDDRIAIGSRKSGLTYAGLLARARTAAVWLAQDQAATVAYAGLNSEAFPLALYASGIAGMPFVPLNYRLPDTDLRRILARTAPGIAIVDDDIVPRVAGVEGITIVPRSEFLDRARGGPPVDLPPPGDPEDIAILLFTSGTTGEPKAAVLRHRHLTSYVISTADFMGAGEEEAALVSVPPYHIAGVAAVLTSTYLSTAPVGRISVKNMVAITQKTAQPRQIEWLFAFEIIGGSRSFVVELGSIVVLQRSN